LSSAFTRQPNVVKGAFLALDANLHVCEDHLFVFQYNPATIIRTISYPDRADDPCDQKTDDPSNGESAPIETIAFQLELDAMDLLEQPGPHPHTVEKGLHPALATLESMMQSLTLDGAHARPIILFSWGSNRITPVRITRLDITEEAFDPKLNPIRATINVRMRVLQWSKGNGDALDYQLLKNYRRYKASLATLYRQSSFIRGKLEERSKEIRRITSFDDDKRPRS
jgi:hypothetical protein